MLDHPFPQPYGPRSRRYPKLGPHTASVRRMFEENTTLPPRAHLSIKAIYERIRDEENFPGSYNSVTDYLRSIAPDRGCIWEYCYDLLIFLEKKRAINFLFLLSRADPPVISPARTQQFFRDAVRVISVAPKLDRRFGQSGRGLPMFLGLHFQGRQPGVRGCFLRRFGIFFEKDRGLIDLGAAYPAKDDEGGDFVAVLGVRHGTYSQK